MAARRARKAGHAVEEARVSLIGDHSNDIQAARGNGFQAVAVATGLMPYEELRSCRPDILVNNLTELQIERLLAY
ncbi:MAG: HAD hydrolase-like protein [Acidobacteriota bacterium]|nr:HAD hydrolase-like protein [Acidobacteriota bacterium]